MPPNTKRKARRRRRRSVYVGASLFRIGPFRFVVGKRFKL